ncbi:DUF2809 domain-containing protein [Metabacillus herbersteinensis]|uniref:DUF2809 domain-containing protein n=2 Tax=Metabacillus herbersteinensis TaxID=283816 RepID=A0ABV6GLC8_9BACI
MGKYLLLVLSCIFLGLASRFTNAFQAGIAVHLGDVLWASMIYFLFRLSFYRKSLHITVGMSFVFCFGIEASQLYQSEWITSIRNTMIGGLILGRGFLWIDLLRYSVGILLAFMIDRYSVNKKL